MADTPISSLSEFLASKRSPITSAHRKFAAAIASEALRGTGHVGRHITSAIEGKPERTYSNRAKSADSASTERVTLSQASPSPKDPPIGTASRMDDVEKQVVRVEAEVKKWGEWVTGEFVKVRGDVRSVLEIAQATRADVLQIKRDLAEETFRKRVAEAKLRSKAGRFMTADQARKDPGSVHPSQAGLLKGILGLLGEGEGAAIAGGVGAVGAAALIRKKLFGSSEKRAIERRVKKALSEQAERAVTKEAASAAEKAGDESLGKRALGSIVGGKGAGIGIAVDALQTMKSDSQSGNHLRSKLRSWLGLDDPGEAAPWSGAMSNRDYEKAKDDSERANRAPGDDPSMKSDSDIDISSKKDVLIKAIQNVKIEARDTLSIKARVIDLDAEKITIKGQDVATVPVKSPSSELATKPDKPDKPDSGYLPGSAGDIRYQDNVKKYGVDKANQLRDVEKGPWWSLGNLIDKVNPFSTNRIAPRQTDTEKATPSQVTPDTDYQGPGKGAYNSLTAHANFMQPGEKYGLPGQNIVSIETAGGHKFRINAASQEAFKRTIEALERAGAPLGSIGGYSPRPGGIAGTGKMSQHSMGNAMDIGSQSARDVITPQLRSWIQTHPHEWRQIMDQNGMISGGDWKNPDLGHIEWSGRKPWLEDEHGNPLPEGTVTADNRGAFRPGQGGESSFLANQRSGFSSQAMKDPALREKFAALMSAEEGGDRDSRVRLAESTMNRASALGVDSLDQAMDPRYYQPFQDGSFSRNLQRIRTDPEYAKSVYADMDRAFAGSNLSNFSTDNASGRVKENAFNHETLASEGDNREGFFRKDVDPRWNGPRNVSKIRQWYEAAKAAIAKETSSKTQVDATASIPSGKPGDPFDESTWAAKDAAWFARPNTSPAPDDVTPSPPKDSVPSPKPNVDSKPDISLSNELPLGQGNNRDNPPTLSDADMVKAIPTPPSVVAPENPDAGQKLTDQIKSEAMDPGPPKDRDRNGAETVAKSNTDPKGRAHSISSPTNHPESEAPRPGSDGYGDQQHDPDDCGICALS